jgi:hypothetical protein
VTNPNRFFHWFTTVSTEPLNTKGPQPPSTHKTLHFCTQHPKTPYPQNQKTMTDFAPPVRHGNFVYHSILYADPGNGHRHARASVAELAALLRQDGPTSAKDQVWHYYSAQLVHYDLPVTKDKNGAKMRLLTALNNFKLKVPDWIRKQESEMKQEWEAENRKLRRAVGAETKAMKAPVLESGRGFDTGSRSVNSTGVNVTGTCISFIHTQAQANLPYSKLVALWHCCRHLLAQHSYKNSSSQAQASRQRGAQSVTYTEESS